MTEGKLTIENTNARGGVGLKIGCGAIRRKQGYVTVDNQDLPSVDLRGDANGIAHPDL